MFSFNYIHFNTIMQIDKVVGIYGYICFILGLEEMQDAHLHCSPDGRQQHSDEERSGHVPLPAANRGWGGCGGDGEIDSLLNNY